MHLSSTKLIAKIKNKQSCSPDIEFSYMETYRILREELGFRHTKVNNKNYFLQQKDGRYQIVNISVLKEEFLRYLIANFSILNIQELITPESLEENVLYKTTPIYHCNSSLRKYLSDNFSISEYDKVLLDFK